MSEAPRPVERIDTHAHFLPDFYRDALMRPDTRTRMACPRSPLGTKRTRCRRWMRWASARRSYPSHPPAFISATTHVRARCRAASTEKVRAFGAPIPAIRPFRLVTTARRGWSGGGGSTRDRRTGRGWRSALFQSTRSLSRRPRAPASLCRAGCAQIGCFRAPYVADLQLQRSVERCLSAPDTGIYVRVHALDHGYGNRGRIARFSKPACDRPPRRRCSNGAHTSDRYDGSAVSMRGRGLASINARRDETTPLRPCRAPVPNLLRELLELADPQRIHYGSDYPFTPSAGCERLMQALESTQLLPEQLRRDIFRDNAVRLFRRLEGEYSTLS